MSAKREQGEPVVVDTPDEAIVRNNLIKFRGDAQMTREQAAARSDLSASTIYKLEKRTRGLPKSMNLKSLVEAYGREIGDVYKPDPGKLERGRVPMFGIDVYDREACEKEAPGLVARAREALAPFNAEWLRKSKKR